ncbi:MAG TPA: hypothetical protein VML75_16605 [Kofleriaceae bacterium]|nr:hypothetical protein [Kofleriaceae bacterium]
MSLVRCLSASCLALLLACGGGNSGPDANTGPCPGTFSMPWPDAENPLFCILPWDETKPPLVLTECGEVFENCSEIGPTPDFSCVDTPPGPPPATPAMVTLRGYVDVFSSGPNADKARVQVFRESQLEGIDDIANVTPLATVDVALDASSLVDARACPKEKDFMQGQCVLPTADCGGQCDKDLAAGQFCYQTQCEDLQRWEVQYQIPGLPTNEFLMIRTVGLDASGNPQVTGNTWAPMFQYNVFLGTNDDACADLEDRDCLDTTLDPPVYQSDVNLLSAQDYMTIPTTAGLSAGITPGNGAFAGEVHDCDGSRIQHAQVGFTAGRTPRVLVYFNGNPVSTLPRLGRAALGTNTLSLYAGLDISPGAIDLVAIGVESDAVREVGRFTARVWPDSVTLVRIGGGRPPQ